MNEDIEVIKKAELKSLFSKHYRNRVVIDYLERELHIKTTENKLLKHTIETIQKELGLKKGIK